MEIEKIEQALEQMIEVLDDLYKDISRINKELEHINSLTIIASEPLPEL